MNAAASAITGVLLAGGQSRRMGGGDKCLLELAGQPMLAHAIARLEPQVSNMVLNANGDAARFAAFGLPVIADPVEGFAGPLAGVLAGCEWSLAHRPDHTHILTVAADTPFFPVDLVERLAAMAVPGGIMLAACDGQVHPVFGLWPVSLAQSLRDWLSDPRNRKILDWTATHRTIQVEFDRAGPLDPFFNINTQEHLAQANAQIERAP